MPIFAFAQFEIPGEVGIDDGRYLVRSGEGEGDDVEDVIVISSLRAPPRMRRGRGRKPADATKDPPADLPLTRATVVRATPLGEAKAWLETMRRDSETRDAFAAEARGLLNRALHAHGVAAMDPYAPELGPQAASSTRIGYGDGDQLASGRWSEAIDAPPDPAPRRRRAEALRPQERLAGLLGGREEIAPYETLILRTRRDLDAGRTREAALQLDPAIRALLAELDPDPAGSRDDGTEGPADEREDLSLLRAQTAVLASAARESLTQTPGSDSVAHLREALELAERVLRRRRILR